MFIQLHVNSEGKMKGPFEPATYNITQICGVRRIPHAEPGTAQTWLSFQAWEVCVMEPYEDVLGLIRAMQAI